MSDVEQIVRDLAAIAAAKKLLADAEKSAKDALQAQLQRGTVYAFTGDEQELGYASVPKPSQPKPQVTIVDEAQAFAWMVEEFGDDVIETKVQLTEQGCKSLDARILKGPIPGVEVTTPEPRPATPRFTPAKNVVELVQGMAARGELSFASLLEIGERP